jgi:hypothetical protein
LLLPQHGIEDSLSIAALGNMLCTLLILPLIANAEPTTSISPESCDTDIRAPLSAGFIRSLVLYATTGFLALGLEMMWFRVLGVMIKSTAFTFGTLISFYLAGLGLGHFSAPSGCAAAHDLSRPFYGCRPHWLCWLPHPLFSSCSLCITAPGFPTCVITSGVMSPWM